MINYAHDLSLIYLIHFTELVFGDRHYVGKTSQDRLHHRMQEHQNGRAALATKMAVERGVTMSLAALILTPDPRTELRLQDSAVQAALCSVCHGIEAITPLPALLPVAKPVTQNDLAPAGVRHSFPANKK